MFVCLFKRQRSISNMRLRCLRKQKKVKNFKTTNHLSDWHQSMCYSHFPLNTMEAKPRNKWCKCAIQVSSLDNIIWRYFESFLTAVAVQGTDRSNRSTFSKKTKFLQYNFSIVNLGCWGLQTSQFYILQQQQHSPYNCFSSHPPTHPPTPIFYSRANF